MNQQLHLACRQPHAETVKLLVSEKANVRVLNVHGDSILHMVAKSTEDSPDLCQHLIKCGANPDVPNRDGKLPCQIALETSKFFSFHVLLSNSQRYKTADKTDSQRTTLLDKLLVIAVQLGNIDICSQLLMEGASCDAELDHRRTGLYLAVTENKLDITRLLLEHGADLQRVRIKGRSAVEWSETEGTRKLASLLQDAGEVSLIWRCYCVT